MRIVGTAGHVDHGKSTLVAALTGIHPDRLKEEKAREMTIDLGFASLTLPNGEPIGIIDVPGHRDFIGNMLSGIGGIDAVLLIIAADEGVSAQTREHLAILDLLEISNGLIVLTKIDLVDDPDWLDLVEVEAREVVAETSLRDVPVIRVSAVTGEGLETLVEAMEQMLAHVPPKADLGRPRLPIDRVFTLAGFGTVVTGTLLDGSFAVGDEVISLPGMKRGRIRGLQNHKHKLQKIQPGYRAAININGVEKDELDRGDVIVLPGTYTPTSWLDAHFRYLPNASAELRSNTEVKVFVGSAEVTARLRLLGKDSLLPGQHALVQLHLAAPVVAMRGDHYVLRRPSPAETLGGGIILDSLGARAHRRFDENNLARLRTLLEGKETSVVLQALETAGSATLATLAQKSGLGIEKVRSLLPELLASEELVTLFESPPDDSMYTTATHWQRNTSVILELVSSFHEQFPLKAGIPRDRLRASSRLSKDIFDCYLDRLSAQGSLLQRGILVIGAGHEVRFTPAQEEIVRPLLAEFEKAPFTPPGFTEAVGIVGADLVEGLVASGRLVRIAEQVLFTPQAYQEMKIWASAAITANGSLTLAEFRDHFNTSRKYSAALLEHLDTIGLTVRKGDNRVLRRV